MGTTRTGPTTAAKRELSRCAGRAERAAVESIKGNLYLGTSQRCPLRLHFREKPWDLFVALGYALVLTGVLLAFNAGDLLALPLIVFVPGYMLAAAFYPNASSIDWIERIALSSGLSIGVVPLLALMLNFTPLGIRLAPLLATMATFSCLVGMLAYWRRMRLPTAERLAATITLEIPGWKEGGLLDRALVLGVIASVVIAGGALAYVLLAPRAGETFTEFYILGPGGNMSGYPTKLNVSQAATVIIGIADHEAATASYVVRVNLLGVRFIYNATSGYNETVVVNATTLPGFNTTLADGQNWTHPYTFSIPAPGLWKVQFLLFKNGDFAAAYRELHLFVRVV